MPRTKRLIISDETAVYHMISRIAQDGFPLGDIEKDLMLDLEAGSMPSTLTKADIISSIQTENGYSHKNQLILLKPCWKS